MEILWADSGHCSPISPVSRANRVFPTDRASSQVTRTVEAAMIWEDTMIFPGDDSLAGYPEVIHLHTRTEGGCSGNSMYYRMIPRDCHRRCFVNVVSKT